MDIGMDLGMPTGVVAEKMGAGEIAAAGLVLGGLFLLISHGPLLLWLESAMPVAVVRGIQLGLALLLVKSALSFALRDPLYAGFGTAVILFFALLTLYRNQLPDLSALILIGAGIGAGVAARGFPEVQFLSFPEIVVPSGAELLTALYLLVPSQALLTITNAILATALLARDLFRQEVPAARLSRTIGLMNLISVPFGGLPRCHGAGGLAAQYRYGARTGAAGILAGVLFCTAAVFFGSPETLLLIPAGLFGALLLFAAIEMAKRSIRTESVTVTAFVGILAVFLSMTVAFVLGIVLAHLLRRAGTTA